MSALSIMIEEETKTNISADHHLKYSHAHNVDHVRGNGIQTAEPESREEGDNYWR